MKMASLQHHLSYYILWISFAIQISSSSSNPKRWGADCPMECQCDVFDLSQTMLSRWKQGRGTAKTAMCVFGKNNQEKMRDLPNDTEVFTFIQALEKDNLTLDQSMMVSLVNARSVDIQGDPMRANLNIANDVFSNMPELHQLSLQRVDLEKAEKAFSKLSSLQVLQITHCNLGILKWEMFHGLSALKELYLVQSKIKELYDFAFYGTPELRKLFLSHNDLFAVDADDLVGLLKLEHLDLSNNKIDHLSGLTFPPMPKLQWLELKHNPIKVIFPHCFQFLNGTQHLTLGHKHQSVHLMKFSFRGLFSLIFLHIPNIDNDVLTEHMFYDLQSLLHLNLQGRIKMINPRAFNGAHKVLQKLILHNCQMEKIMEDAFNGLNKLITLDLSSNYLHYLNDGLFDPLQSLRELHLNNNQIKTLPNTIFQPLTNLRALRLDTNPWNCTCEMSLWKEELTNKMSHAISHPCSGRSKSKCMNFTMSYVKDDSLEPRCEYPRKYQGQNVFDVLRNRLSCENFNAL